MSQNKLTKYDIAVSFTEEDSEIAQQVTNALRRKGFSVYFYKNVNQLSQNLSKVVQVVYGNRSNYGLVILSKDYKQKRWTMREWKSLKEAKRRYKIKGIFIIKVGGRHHLPGLSRSTIYHKWNNDPRKVARMIKEQVKFPPNRLLKYIKILVVITLITLGIYYSIKLNVF